ncbi:MAG TPA: redoxin family protein, partial [Candidatus Dormibacteraeota bacterium]|nr:redoxin family protein [Candidatus Dormibacteraeota bacterium]
SPLDCCYCLSMRLSSRYFLWSVFALFTTASLLAADTTSAPAGGTEGDKAWKELVKAMQPPMPPAEWQGHPSPEQLEEFHKQQGEIAGKAAEKAREFYTKFPNHPKAAEARKDEVNLLQVAVQRGNTNQTAVLEAREKERLNDPSLSEDERYRLRIDSVRRGMMANRSDEAASRAFSEKSARELIKDFPKKDAGYELLLQVAGESDPKKSAAIAKELAAGDAPKEVKERAEGLLRKMEALGKPLPIKFTSVDGREVDLTKMEGKVVLIDFWATWCGPCVGEIPNVKKAYEKLHPKGFEIVGISFDTDKSKLSQFVEKQEMTWPQYFDGKQWGNKFGQEYGINSIPAMWLLDKKGLLRDMNARGSLEEKVEKLLAE